ncbi:AAA family ATPase [Comamonas sp. JC664]|uniref:AAA family ATPase n=1 Tax=Comamonas sp. JC664 TaxID=2801917 RepID=UPI00174C7856|nr:AAA family ATPase [Comamonas sp. JC664]MBL0694357.1 ATP-binding protein [Comamonas sp. JC664]GHG77171.1 hypothetical protein GCM10012319_26900 [Comamonas sp. KCTC 72670]
MRIAVTGSHRVGKSTLIDLLGEQLEGYRLVEEPYLLLEEDGYAFASPPSLEDFVEQLRFSAELLHDEKDSRDTLFDRCPVDFLGYLQAHEDAEAFDLEEWLPRVRSAVQTLDLIVFVPVEEPDRIRLRAREDLHMRTAVDEALSGLLNDDPHAWGVEVLAVQGSTNARVKQVLERLGRGTSSVA